MKNITKTIEALKKIKKNGGDINTYNISTPVRDARPGDPNYSFTDAQLGFRQFCHDGTFAITLTGTFKQHEPNTGTKKSAGKKKGKKRSN